MVGLAWDFAWRVVSDEGILQLTVGPLRIDSVSPSLVPGGLGEEAEIARTGANTCRAWARGRYQEFGRAAQRGRCLEGHRGGKGLMLNGHIDTVNTAGMDIDPLYPRYETAKSTAAAASI
jgi:acetylornithine deacetylase/succinyl-diaminopimelate desuccinylase-like protein